MNEPATPTPPPPAVDLRPTPPRARLLSSRALAIGATLFVAMAWVILQAVLGSAARPKGPAPAPPPPGAAEALRAQIDSALAAPPQPRSFGPERGGEGAGGDPWGGSVEGDPFAGDPSSPAGPERDPLGSEPSWEGGRAGSPGGPAVPPPVNPLREALESPIHPVGGPRGGAGLGGDPALPAPPDFGAILAALAAAPGGGGLPAPPASLPGPETRGPASPPASTPPPANSRLGPQDLAAGTVLPAVLSHRLESDLPGPVTARVAADVRDTLTGSRVLIPAGAQLLGRTAADLHYGDRRLAVVWEQLTFPDGRRLALDDPSADASGVAGLSGRTDNHLGRLFGGTLLLSLLGAGAQLSQPDSYNGAGTLPGLTPGQVAAASLGQRVSEVSTEVIRREMAVKPTIEIAAGTLFNVFLIRDLHLPSP